jgi:SsrA-binding protein
MKSIINKKAHFDYLILETFKVGIKLLGHEVKSIRSGKANLKGAFITFKGETPYLTNAHISPYQIKNIPGSYNPERPRKILLKSKEIQYLQGKMTQRKNLTIVPLKLYSTKPKDRIILEIGLAQGKTKRDKREDIKKREFEREKSRSLKI